MHALFSAINRAASPTRFGPTTGLTRSLQVVSGSRRNARCKMRVLSACASCRPHARPVSRIAGFVGEVGARTVKRASHWTKPPAACGHRVAPEWLLSQLKTTSAVFPGFLGHLESKGGLAVAVAVLTTGRAYTRAADGHRLRQLPSAARGWVRWARTMQPAEDIAFAPAALASYPCRQGNFVKVRRSLWG